MRTKFSSTLIALLLVAPGLAVSQTATNPNGMTYEQFHHLDKDGSGTISEAEYREFMEGAFNELDTNKDGRLTSQEAARVLSTDQFSKIDTNRDGSVSRSEFLEHVMNDFHRQDHDKNGELRP